MEILKQKHEELTKLELVECDTFAELEDAQYSLKLEEADILLNTTKEDWKELGITNEAGRKAYVTTKCEYQIEKVKELKKELKYIHIKQEACKRVINYYMAKMEAD